ncbi:hypothetical protein [Flavobacterium rhizosphaerae]|uniref:Uncharacterized protein n=1 Tax=Flavobacterium rhizosphaerae TaxID=3163298 RepID=A0ABW8YXS8_9FLAO
MPEHLGECEGQQYVEMCGLLYRYMEGEITFADVKVHAVYKLLNLKPSGRTLMPAEEEDKWSNIYKMSELIESFFEERNGRKIMRVDYFHNPVPRFRPLWKYYYGPADAMANITFGEYLDCLRLFMEHGCSRNEKHLYLMAAILYRKAKPLPWLQKMLPGYKGDIRRKYNEHTAEEQARSAFKYCPKGFIYGVYLMFASFQKFITTAVVPWGGRNLDLSILFDESEGEFKEAVPGLGMDGVAYALAENGQLGNFDKVRNTNLWEVFMLLYHLKKNELDRKLNEKHQKS